MKLIFSNLDLFIVFLKNSDNKNIINIIIYLTLYFLIIYKILRSLKLFNL